MPFYESNAFLFSVNFNQCNLDLATFTNLKLIGTTFKKCSLQKIDFTNADMSKTNFDDCNLKDAVFENTILEASDFSKAYNFKLNPYINKIRGAKFSRVNIDGLLLEHQIIIE